MEISICDNASEPITDVLAQGLRDSSEAYIASAFITEAGLGLLMQELNEFAQASRHKLIVVTGNYLDFTTSGALRQLRDLEQLANKQSRSEPVRVKFVRDPTIGAFHPKVYLFMGKRKALLVVGSGNLTARGGGDNIEAYIKVCGTSQMPLFQDAKRLIQTWSGEGSPITNDLITDQVTREGQHKARETLASLLTPFLNTEHGISIDEYIRMCEFVRGACDPLTTTAKTLLQCAREGRIVELHLSHGGLWLPLPGVWFNVDRQRSRDQRISTATQVGYHIFGKGIADRLQKLESAVRVGSENYGWKTRRGVFVPDSRWDEYNEWFEKMRLQYAEVAESVLKPVRGRAGRAEEGLREAIDSTWRRYNPRKPLRPGLVGEVREALRKRLDDIRTGRRQAWRFECRTFPHPVVAWSAALPGLSGIERSSSGTSDELADLALANLRWLADRLDSCPAKPEKCAALSAVLLDMNVIQFPVISEAAVLLREEAAKRLKNRIKETTWKDRREAISSRGSLILDEIVSLETEPGDSIMRWLEEFTTRALDI